jgi:hypothetical protein
MELPKYQNWSPTGFDPKGLNCDDQQDWLVAPVSINRDSGPLEQSNWEYVIADLERDHADTDWEINRFGHWACGWFEIILLRPGTSAADYATEIADDLQDYCILDESDFCEKEHECCEEAYELDVRDDFLKAIHKLLPNDGDFSCWEEWYDDDEKYLEVRGVTQDAIDSAFWEHAEWYVESDGSAYVYDIDKLAADIVNNDFPVLLHSGESWRLHLIAQQTMPLPFD